MKGFGVKYVFLSLQIDSGLSVFTVSTRTLV